MPVTQKQIAQKVGLTQQAVALALRDSPRVAEPTRKRVQKIARELGYSRDSNRHARSLAARRHGKKLASNILAVILEAAPDAPVLPYFTPLIGALEAESVRRELDLLLVTPRATGLPWLLTEGWVDGAILVGWHDTLYGLDELNLPIVALGTELKGVRSLTPRDEEGAYLATRNLIELGHQKIAFLGPKSWSGAKNRRAGFRRAMREANLEINPALVETNLKQAVSSEEAALAFQKLRARGEFSALVCHNDPLAMGAIRAAQNLEIKVPRDLSVTGFDDVSAAYQFSPLVSSVAFDRAAMGKRAVELIFEAGQSEKFDVEFRERETTARGNR